MRTDSRELLGVGIFGSRSHIVDRIEALLSRGRTFSPRASAARITASAIVLAVFMLVGSMAPRWIAFAQQQPRPAFEVASIKANKTAPNNSEIHFDPGRLTAENVPASFLIIWAYHVRMFQLSGGPGWINSEKFDIAAKLEGGASSQQVLLMMQTLLEERFKLRLHRETKEHSVYTLVPAKSGIKLRASTADCEALAREDPPGQPSRRQCGAWFRGSTQFTGTKISMTEFVEDLANLLERPVVDKTGFTENFDVTLQWTPDEQPPENSDAPSPAIFTALQEQLGLKLESGKSPVETLVIDHIEKPDAN
jgi:uncharacterized protein (TIGR03435 family)